MKRLLIFMQMLIAFAAGVSAQETLTVCDGTNTNSNLPIAGFYSPDGEITSQMIYPAADLAAMNGKKITSITFYSNEVVNDWSGTSTWNLAEVEETVFSSKAFLTPEFTQVASVVGVSNASDKSWTITFSTPYVYNGGNLLIQAVMPTGGANNKSFYGVSQSTNTAYTKYNDWGYWESDYVKFLPKVTFTYENATTDPVDPSEPTVATFDFLGNPWNHAWGSGSAGQDSYTAGDITEPLLADGVSLSFNNENASTPARFWNQKGVRAYSNAVVTVAAPEGKAISKIVVTAEGSSYLGTPAPFVADGATSTLTLDEAVASYNFTLSANARWTSMDVTLVSAGSVEPEPTPFEIPEGYNEVENWKEIFTGFPYTIGANALSLGWNYIDCQADYPGMFSRNTYYSVEGGSSLNITNTSTYNKVDYLVSPAVKGDVAIKARALSYSTSYAGTQYVKFYKVTRNEDGTFNAPTDADFIKEIDLGVDNTFKDFEIGNFSDYTYVAITGSRAYLDILTATSAVMPENPALQVTAIASEWTDSNKLYADAEGKFTWTGTFKVKNTGDVDLVAGRDNYSVTVTSQSTGQITIPETVIPISVNLAVGEESEDIELSLECTLVDQTKTESRSAIRVTSDLLAYGATNTSSLYYKQAAWFTAVSYAPSLMVWTEGTSSLDEKGVDFGLGTGSVSKAISLKNAGGSNAVITAINSTFAEGFSTDAELPLTIAPDETKQINFIIGGNAGFKEGTVTIVYADGVEYTTKTISATVVPEGTYLETFGSEAALPNGWINQYGSNWEAQALSGNGYVQNTLQQYPEAMLISPKIAFAEGQALTVGATKRVASVYSYSDPYLQVYYSTDRVNWQKANVITYSAEKTSCQDWEESQIMFWDATAGTTVNDIKAYTINGIPAGEYYIGFRSGYALMDYIFGGTLASVDNDINVSDFTVDAGKSMVNYPVSVSVSYANMTDHAAAAHTVALYDGETLLEEKAGAELAAYGNATAEFGFTPHVAGAMSLKVVIKNVEGEYSVETPVKDITIAEEAMAAEAMAGTHTGTTSSGNALPIALYYYNSRAEWIWTANEMTLDNGANINSLTFFYYLSGNKDLTGKKVRIYMANTDETLVETAMTDVTTMTEVFSDDNFTYVHGGSSSSFIEMAFPFIAPFEYTGGNLRVVVISEDENKNGEASGYFETYYTTSGRSNGIKNDTYNTYKTTTSASRQSYVPVAKLSIVATAPVLSGVVSNAEEAPIADAVVTVASGNVIYTGTTDAEGNYSISIKQPTLAYKATAAAEGYFTSDEATVNVSAGNATQDFTLDNTVYVPVEFGDYATFFNSEYALKATEGVEVYYFDANELKLVQIEDGVIPAATGVVLKGVETAAAKAPAKADAAKTLDLKLTTTTATIANNALAGTDEEEAITADDSKYFYAIGIADSNLDSTIGYYWQNETGAAFTNQANRAYLALDKAVVDAVSEDPSVFYFDPQVTGINELRNGADANVRYNIAGQRVTESHKGLIITEGRKMIQK